MKVACFDKSINVSGRDAGHYSRVVCRDHPRLPMALAAVGYQRRAVAYGYGLFDLIGNVWEWTTDFYQPKHTAEVLKACCIPRNPLGASVEASYDPRQPAIKIPRKVIKGGSHLCAPNYCRRYRPAARFPEPIDTSTCHLGFRCIVRSRREEPDAAGL